MTKRVKSSQVMQTEHTHETYVNINITVFWTWCLTVTNISRNLLLPWIWRQQIQTKHS